MKRQTTCQNLEATSTKACGTLHAQSREATPVDRQQWNFTLNSWDPPHEKTVGYLTHGKEKESL